MKKTRPRSACTPSSVSPAGTPTRCTAAQELTLADDAEHLIEFSISQRPVGCRDRTQYVRVQVDFVQGNPVVDAKIQLPGNRAHLPRCRLRPLPAQGTCR